MMQEGWTLLDVRSPGEANKVPIVGAVNVSAQGNLLKGCFTLSKERKSGCNKHGCSCSSSTDQEECQTPVARAVLEVHEKHSALFSACLEGAAGLFALHTHRCHSSRRMSR